MPSEEETEGLPRQLRDEAKRVGGIAKETFEGVPIAGQMVRLGIDAIGEVEPYADLVVRLGKSALGGLRPRGIIERLPPIPRYAVKLGIPFAVLLLFLLIPSTLTGMDRGVQTCLGIFAFAALMWTMESLPLAVTALLVPALLSLFLVFSSDPTESITLSLRPFAHPVIYLVMGGMMLSEAFRKHGLDRRLAHALLRRTDGRVAVILPALMILTIVFSMWISNTATVALLVPVAIGIAGRAPAESRAKLASILLLGIGMGSSIGGMGTVVGTAPNAIASALLAKETTWTFLSWMKIGLPVAILLFFLAWLVLGSRLPEGVRRVGIEDGGESKKLSKGEKYTIAIMCITILLWMFAPQLIAFATHFFGFEMSASLTHATVVSLVAIALLFITRTLDWGDVRTMPWDIYLIIGAGLALGQGLGASGAADWIASSFADLSDGMALIFILLAVSVITVVLTNIMSNTALVSMFVPILIPLSYSIGLDPKILVMVCALSGSVSFLTPIGTPPYTIIYGTGYITRGDMLKTGLWVSVPAMLIVITMVVLYSHLGIL